MNINVTLEMRGMKRKEIMAYFLSIDEKYLEPDQFIGEGWNAKVNEEKDVRLGSINIPSTVVEFSGNKEQLEQVIADFRLKFLTAGG